MTALVDLGGRPKRTFGSATWIHLISLRMPEHSVESRMLGFITIHLKNRSELNLLIQS
jgi:hypothetical protein